MNQDAGLRPGILLLPRRCHPEARLRREFITFAFAFAFL
jgi:hypothetical protein